jgi:hypothetical protein
MLISSNAKLITEKVANFPSNSTWNNSFLVYIYICYCEHCCFLSYLININHTVLSFECVGKTMEGRSVAMHLHKLDGASWLFMMMGCQLLLGKITFNSSVLVLVLLGNTWCTTQQYILCRVRCMNYSSSAAPVGFHFALYLTYFSLLAAHLQPFLNVLDEDWCGCLVSRALRRLQVLSPFIYLFIYLKTGTSIRLVNKMLTE